MRKIYFLLSVLLFAANSFAQISGTKTIPGDYATIAAAVNALNTSGISGPVVFQVAAGHTETAPTGGILLGSTTLNATLSSTNTLTFVKTGTGANPLITAQVGTGALDGIFVLQGVDFTTIDGIDLQERSTNTTSAQAVEWGYAMLNLTAADGCQDNTIRNCKVTFQRVVLVSSSGIYLAHHTTSSSTAFTLTLASGANSRNKFYSNTIINAQLAIYALGFNHTTAPYSLLDQNNEFGGTAASLGNSIISFGGVVGGTGYINAYGIIAQNQNAAVVSFNTITQKNDAFGGYGIALTGAGSTHVVSNNNITTAGFTLSSPSVSQHYGIFTAGTNSNAIISNNVISTSILGVASGSATALYGIRHDGAGNFSVSSNTIATSIAGSANTQSYAIHTSLAAGTITITSNSISQSAPSISLTTAHAGVFVSSTASGGATVSNNLFSNYNVFTSGRTSLLDLNSSTQNLVVANNTTSGTMSLGGSGSKYGYYNAGFPTGGAVTITQNNFSNITVAASSIANFWGVYHYTSNSQAFICSNNTLSNISMGSGSFTGINDLFTKSGSSVSANIISNISGSGGITGYSTSSSSGNQISSNTISSLSSSGTSAIVTGLSHSSGTNSAIFNNKIYDLTGSGSSPSVYGMTLSGGTTSMSVYNNIIGNLTAPAANSTSESIRGINITSSTSSFSVNVNFNTVYLNATSSGANFSTSGIFHAPSTTATTSSLSLSNNIIVNLSTPNGSGLTVALRRSATTPSLSNFASASNNNLFYAGLPCATRLVYFDGTNSDQGLAAYKSRVAPRESASVTEEPSFLSTVGSSSNFLHINTTIPTQIQAGGVTIPGITLDFDGDTRASTPDIGADEFAGVAATACSGTPTPGSIPSNISICSGSSTSICLTGQSSNAGIQLAWQTATSLTGPFTDVACAGSSCLNTGNLSTGTRYYRALITCNASGLTATTNVATVQINANPVISASSATSTICAGSSGTTLTATGGATYSWLPSTGLSATSGNSVIASPSVTTVYIVTGTDINSCSGTASVTVNVIPQPSSITISPAGPVCLSNSAVALSAAGAADPTSLQTVFIEGFEGSVSAWTLTNTSTGGTPAAAAWTIRTSPYVYSSYSISSNDASKFFMSNSDAQGNGGTTLTRLTSPSFSTVGLQSCNLQFYHRYFHYSGGAATIEASINGGSSWSTVVSYTSSIGADNAFALSSVDLSSFIGNPSVILRFTYSASWGYWWAIDNIVVRGSLPAPITWSPASGLFSNASATTAYVAGTATTSVFALPLTPSSSTIYTATATGANGCLTTKTVVINRNPAPSISGSTSVCSASTQTYSVTNTPGNTYTWSVNGGTIVSGTGTNSVSVLWAAAGAGTVSVTETVTATGCTATATQLNVTINPLPTPVITGSLNTCAVSTQYIYSVASVTGNTYSWTISGGSIISGGTSNSVTVVWDAAGPGTVAVTQVVTATGCSTSVSSNVTIIESPTATATVVEPVTCASEDGQINLTLGGAAGPYTFAWTGTGNGLSATTQNQPVVSTGFYNVTVTAANGCTTSLTNVVVSGPGGCFICPTIGTITSTATIICQDGANTITAGGLADLGITYGIRFKYSATPLANPYLSTAGTVMGTVSNANLTVVGGTTTSTSASINYNFPTAGTMYVYAILSPSSPDPACRPFLMIPVEVAPTPVLTRPADQVRCTGSATAAVNFLAAPATTTTFAWTNNRTSIGLAASGTGNIASFTATNFTNAPVTALITVTPTNTQTLGASTVVCPGPAQTYSYTINPIPTVNTVTNQSVCAGTTVSLPFSGFVPGTVYEWTNSNTAIGLAATGTGTLSYTATNNTSSPITATIIVTPKFTSAGGTCTGNPISFDITVNPTPVVDAIPAQVLCSGNATTAISLTSATTGTAFSWTNSATSVGLAGTGTGTSIASFTAVNTGAAPVNAIISITPSYTGAGFTCTGSVGTTTITVNPIPATTGIADRVICNGAATTFTLTGPVTAAVYNWTNSNTGIGLAGTGSGTIAFTASNTTGAPITSTIEVTPSITNAGLACVGGTSSFTVTVNPSGQVNAIDNQVLCNGSATSAVTFSTVNNGLISTGGSQVASSGTISVAVPDASAVGATHTIPVTLPTGAVITNMRVTMNLTHTWISDMIINLRAPNGQVLNLFNGHGGSGDNLVNTIISSTGTASLASGTAPFTGTFAATAAIGVGPTGNASTAANFAALYSTANGNWILSMRDLELGDLGTLTGWSIAFDYVVQGQFGTNMNWTNSLSSIGLAATGTGNIPSFTAANTTAAPVVSTVTVTPSYFNAGTSCPGAPVTFTYTVNPTPTVNTVANQVFCAGTPSTVNFSGATTGTVFNWTSSNAAIGLATSGSGNLSFTPTNTSNVPIVSTITVTPVFTNDGVTCTGTPRTFTITVNPVGQVNTVLNQVICNGAGTAAVNFATVNGGGTVQVGTPVTANSGAITVAIPDASAAGTTHTLPVTLPAGATITGVSVNFNMTHTWLSDMVVNLRAPNGQILNLVNRRGGSGDNFVNTTISSASTTSLATGAAPFTGTFAADGALNVGPTTFVSTATNFAALYSVANGDWTLGMRDYAGGDLGTLTGWSITFNYTTVAGAVTTYNWTNTTPSIGLAASGVGNIASFAAANTSTVPVTATVSVIPTYTNAGVGCAGPASSFTYTVNPTPTVNAVSNQAVCRGSNVAAISFGGTVSGTVYNWTNTNTAIGLAASGTGDIASFVGANTTSAPISGTITVTPVFTNAGITCTGTPRTFTITVNPIPTVNSVASFPVCHNSVAAVTFSGATTGTVYNWTNNNTAIGLAASGTGNLNFTAQNTTSAPRVATITVTPVFTNGGTACTGTPISFTITVNPLPVVSAGTLPARICISDTLVPLNGTPVGGSWSGIGTSGMNFIPTATALGTWPITYTFSDINGCTNRATIAATVLSCDERDRDLDNSAVLLYPNPNSGQFNLRINSTRFNALGMRVFNTAGQLVSTKQWNGLVYARVVPVNLTNLPAGIYMVRLYYGDGMDRGADKTYQIVIAR